MRERVGALIIKDRTMLMVTGPGARCWWTPGGGKDEGETDEQALRRELAEELGAEIVIGGRYLSFRVPHEPTGETLESTYYLASLTGIRGPQAEISEFGWFSREDFASGTVEPLPAFAEHVLPRLLADTLL